MTMLTAHPKHATVGVYQFDRDYNILAVDAPIRRLASVSSRRYIIDLLSNRDGIVRADWDYSLTFGRFTIAVLAR